MNHFGIATKRSGDIVFLEKTKEELIKLMNKLSNDGSDEYVSICVYSANAFLTKRKFISKKPKVTQESFESFLIKIKGVSVNNVGGILEVAESKEDIISLGVASLIELDGIGKATAEAIFDACKN